MYTVSTKPLSLRMIIQRADIEVTSFQAGYNVVKQVVLKSHATGAALT